ncbi:hypothetical protein DLJ53_01890 [Acuticoccus sediminis]|uniref:Lectin-like protein BA14k n=1 Tax=Acuticoccus sediminis TaxID=2184697 RepID=A0A8B2NYR6_9HYPH|nr:BA14K family protein [Acuticoccus sediminis]RAI03295.1 hypothetical protein DLJ53_01890 [Acuticoccus sediminis]
MRALTLTVAAAALLTAAAAHVAPAAADPANSDQSVKSWVRGRPFWQNYSGYPAPDPQLAPRGSTRSVEGMELPTDGDFSLFGPLGANLMGATAGVVIRSVIPSQRYDGPGTPTGGHMQLCKARYPTYNPQTDSYTTATGEVRRCPL